MIFNIKSTVSKEIKRYSKNSAEIIFCRDNSEMNKLAKERKIKLNAVQKNNFEDGKISELQIWLEQNPDLFIIKMIDEEKKLNNDFFRNFLAGHISSFGKAGIKKLYVNIPDYSNFKKMFESEEYFYQTFIEGVLLGNYNFDIYKADKKKPTDLAVEFISTEDKVCKKSLKNAQSLIDGVSFARDLVNEPANTLTPAVYAKRVKSTFHKTKVSVKVFGERELAKRKMNAILSVGRGSDNRPNLILAHYKPKSKAIKKICLVGKGVTYDTGGLSIKPTSGMLDMKADMGGSAVVFGIIKAAEKLNLPFEIIGIVPAVENAINGNAYKPGDVISTASGKTIEVKDTDAEGRIVLADALEYASKQKPDEIIDFATLTGACVVALGEMAAGIFTKNEKMSTDLVKASKETYEHAWPLPFWDEYNKLIESKIADVSNLGPRWGGAITAGKFLEHFVDANIPWTHIDLAGPTLKHDLTNYTKDYCTGYGVRLIIKYFEQTS